MNLLIRADASSQIGTGHVMRCLALAQAWLRAGGQVTLLMATVAPALETRLLSEGLSLCHISAVLGSEDDAVQTVKKAKSLASSWVVIDGYHFGSAYQKAIKASGLKLLVVDDYGHSEYYWADLVLNQNIYADESLYQSRENRTQLLLGSRYALLRKEFWPWYGWQRQNSSVANKVLVTLGGADPDNVTMKAIDALRQVKGKDLEAVVVAGASNPHYEALSLSAQKAGAIIKVKRNVTNMPDLMAWADVAISAGGTTCWELAFMGLPSLILTIADNQQAVAEHLDASGAAISLGWHQNIEVEGLQKEIEKLLESPVLRRKASDSAQALVDGKGSNRVMVLLQDRKIKLREAIESDRELLWQWANDASVRNFSFSSTKIEKENHLRWFSQKLKSPVCHIFIALDLLDTPVGQVRFDIKQDRQAEIGISIDKNKRGLGYGVSLIEAAVAKIFDESPVRVINALIKQENSSSIVAFEKAKFRRCEELIVQGHSSLRYTIAKEHL